MVLYIDTNILLALSGYNKIDKDMLWVLKKKFRDKEIRIPEVVLGEALREILKERNIRKIPEFLENLKDKLLSLENTSCKFPSTNNKIIKCAKELQGISSGINDMDSVILAHPMMDNDATHFYTNDSALKDHSVYTYMKNLIEQNIRTRELNIPEEFTGG